MFLKALNFHCMILSKAFIILQNTCAFSCVVICFHAGPVSEGLSWSDITLGAGENEIRAVCLR